MNGKSNHKDSRPPPGGATLKNFQNGTQTRVATAKSFEKYEKKRVATVKSFQK